jgi:hypothetical protein
MDHLRQHQRRARFTVRKSQSNGRSDIAEGGPQLTETSHQIVDIHTIVADAGDLGVVACCGDIWPHQSPKSIRRLPATLSGGREGGDFIAKAAHPWPRRCPGWVSRLPPGPGSAPAL